MKVVKSTHRHKLHKEYEIIVDYNKSTKDIIEFNTFRRRLIKVFGPKFINRYDDYQRHDDDVRNPKWFWEEFARYGRRRLYFKSQKEWQWAQLAR